MFWRWSRTAEKASAERFRRDALQMIRAEAQLDPPCDPGAQRTAVTNRSVPRSALQISFTSARSLGLTGPMLTKHASRREIRYTNKMTRPSLSAGAATAAMTDGTASSTS
ncbi:MAG: hypothetical protein IPI43_24100 [Sandaracinaceae bacterium]|nr:hypothetical protein [Sandaracinaceae bacterium]